MRSDFVSFRPGELANDLGKRADGAEVSLTAKGLLKATFALLKAECARLRSVFGAAEIQAIVAALYDDPCEPDQVVVRLCEAIGDPSKLTATILRRNRVDQDRFLEKVRALGPAGTFAIADSVNQMRRMPINEFFGLDALPSFDALRRVGLVATLGPAAWGFCIVSLKGSSIVQEYVLRRDLAGLRLSPSTMTVDELAFLAAEHSRDLSSGRVSPADERRGFWACYQIAQKTGLRYFRIEQDRDIDDPKVVQIPRQTLVSDIRDGSLQYEGLPPLVLAGLNAPDDADREAMAGEQAPKEGEKNQENRASVRKASDKPTAKPRGRKA